jgi:hypothetical protein
VNLPNAQYNASDREAAAQAPSSWCISTDVQLDEKNRTAILLPILKSVACY